MTASETPLDGRITTERLEHVFAIGIDRPKKLNGFSPKMLVEMAEAYTAFERDEGAWVGLLFAHGAQLHRRAGARQGGADHARARHGVSGRPASIPSRCVRRCAASRWSSAVQGICFTIGIELMLAADVVVAADACRFAQIEVKRGIMPVGGATLRMVERGGWGNAMRYLLTGDEFGAAEALRMGFVQEVVPAGKQLARALEIARGSLPSRRRWRARFACCPRASPSSRDRTRRSASSMRSSRD